MCKNKKSVTVIDWLEKNGRTIWYMLLLVLSIVYVAINFYDFISTELLKEFTGRHVLFIVCLALLVSPLFDSFEGFGFKLSRSKKEQMDSELSELSKKVLTKDDIQVKNLETEFEKVKRYEEK